VTELAPIATHLVAEGNLTDVFLMIDEDGTQTTLVTIELSGDHIDQIEPFVDESAIVATPSTKAVLAAIRGGSPSVRLPREPVTGIPPST